MNRTITSTNTTRTDQADHNGYNLHFNITINTNQLDSISVMGYKDANFAFSVTKGYSNPNLTVNFQGGNYDFEIVQDVINELDVIVAELTQEPTED